VIEINQVDAGGGGQFESTPTADPPSTNNGRPTPTTPPMDSEQLLLPRKKPRKSVLDNVIEFSLGSPKTLRQAVHQAKALYDKHSRLRQEVSSDLPRRTGKGVDETRPSTGTRLESKGKAPSKIVPAPEPVRSKITSKPPMEPALRQARRRGETGATRSRQPVRDMDDVASQTNGRNPRTIRSKAPETTIRGIKGSSQDPIVLDDRRAEEVIGSGMITSRMSKTTEAAFLARLGSGLGAVTHGGPSNALSVDDFDDENPRGLSREEESVGQPVTSTSASVAPDLEGEDMHIAPATSGSAKEKLTPRKRKATENPVDKRTVKTRKVDESVRPAAGNRVMRVKAAVQGSNPVEPGPSRIRVRKAAENVSTGPSTTEKPAPKMRVKAIRSQNDERPRTRSARRKAETAVDLSRSASPALEQLPVPLPEPARPKRANGSAGIGTKRLARDLGQPRRPDNR